MNKTDKLRAILQEIGRPFALMVHRTQPAVPFFTYFYGPSDNFIADNFVYHEDAGIGIQIVSDKKEMELERQLKDKLNRDKIPWSQDPDYYDQTTKTFIAQINI